MIKMAWEAEILLLFNVALQSPTPSSWEFHDVYSTVMFSRFETGLMLVVKPSCHAQQLNVLA